MAQHEATAGILLPRLVVFDLDNCCWNPEMYQLSGGSAPFTYNADENTCLSRGGETVALCSDVSAVWGSIHNANGDATGAITLGELVLSQELGVDVAACRRQKFGSKEEVLRKVAELRGYNSMQQSFVADLIWEGTMFNGSPSDSKHTLIAIASCCDEPAWAREILQKFRIFDPTEQRWTVSMADTIASQDLVQIHHTNKTQHHKYLKAASGIPFEDMIFFDDQMGNIRSVSGIGVLSIQTSGDDGVSWKTFVEGLRQFNAAKKSS